MKAFKIYFEGENIIVPITPEENTTIHIFDNNGKGYLYIDSVCMKDSKRSIWANFVPIHTSTEVEVEIQEVDEISKPENIIKENSNLSVKSKLETFRELESYLQKKGLL